MKISKLAAVVALVLASSACGWGEPSDDKPDQPKTIREMYIDPESRSCAKYKRVNGKRACASWKTDDKDWVIVTDDGQQYDVDEGEYNSVKVGGKWPNG